MKLISDSIINVKRMLLSCLLMLLAGISLAGNTEVQITHFSEKDGLPQSVFTGVIQDSKGYIWIRSGNGLCIKYVFLYPYIQADYLSVLSAGVSV